MVRASKMCRQDKCQPTGRTLRGQPADPRRAACAVVALATGCVVARAKRDVSIGGERTGGEPHHEQGSGTLLQGAGDGWCRPGEEELAVVHLVHGNAVVGFIAGVGPRAEFCADGNLCGESDDGHADPVGDEVTYGVVNIARVAR